MKKIVYLAFMAVAFIQCKAAETQLKTPPTLTTEDKQIFTKPKLVVGIVVDQMRYDYLTRFWDKYQADGFKRLINEGFVFKNNHFNYVPTYTGPGHTSVFTGTSPAVHGIIGNNWYDKEEKTSVYCAQDDEVNSVGTQDKAGKMSPKRMKTTTFADQNRLHTQFKGKTIGVAIKDRGAILPAGHSANAAYWFHGKDEGKFISSTYYLNELPTWVKDFNTSGVVASYLKVWDTKYPIETYTESTTDHNNYEHGFRGKETATFPYDLAKLKDKNKNFEILKATPYGNSLTVDFALAAIKGEQLGADAYTDVLTLSFSSPDYIGHNFGVSSKEIQDNYLRLDQDLARLLTQLDELVGEGEYTVFLTSDHGAVEVPAYLQDHKIPAGYFDVASFSDDLRAFTKTQFGSENIIEDISNNQLFLNKEELKKQKLSSIEVENKLKEFLIAYPLIDKVFTRNTLENTYYNKGVIGYLVQNGYNQKRSGDVVVAFDPGYVIYPKKGSTHGTAFNYDTHSPLIFFGKGIKNGQTLQRSHITDIAPTISALLGVAFPNAATGDVLYQALEDD